MVRRIEAGGKWADSRRTRVHQDPLAGDAVQVEGVQRLALVDQQVVGDVDDGAEGPLSVQVEAAGHPQRRGPGRVEALRDPRVVHRAAFGVVHLDAGQPGGRGTCLGHGEVERPQLAAEHQGGLAGDAADGQGVAAVGEGLDVKDGVAQADRLVGEVGADRGVGWQHQDAGVVVEHAELAGGGEHPVRPAAADLAAADLQAAGELGSGRGPGDHVAGAVVVGAADHLAWLGARVDGDQGEPVGVGVAGDVEDPGGDDPGDVVPDPVDGLDLQAGEGELVGQCLRSDVAEVDVLGQPGERYAHGVPPFGSVALRRPLYALASQRRSLSVRVRMSARPERSM